MSESKKSVVPHNCPVCGVSTNYIYRIKEKDSDEALDWFRCECGVIFPDNVHVSRPDDVDSVAVLRDKKLKPAISHAARTYAPLIEELTYGRMILDVGFSGSSINIDYFRDRGWLTWAIDVNQDIEPKGNIYKGDFTTYDFSLSKHMAKIEKEIGVGEKAVRLFDVIWMGHVLERFARPMEVLHKAYNLLNETGVLYISTPDIGFISKTGVPFYPHWKSKRNSVLWSETALKREVERIGFKVIMLRRNFCSRFFKWYDIHLICQKKYF